MTETHAACTVLRLGVPCGAAAVYVEREFAECAKHAAEFGSLAATRHLVGRTVRRVGDEVEVARHGKTYVGRVVRVGARGAVYAEVEYGNGARREVRV